MNSSETSEISDRNWTLLCWGAGASQVAQRWGWLYVLSILTGCISVILGCIFRSLLNATFELRSELTCVRIFEPKLCSLVCSQSLLLESFFSLFPSLLLLLLLRLRHFSWEVPLRGITRLIFLFLGILGSELKRVMGSSMSALTRVCRLKTLKQQPMLVCSSFWQRIYPACRQVIERAAFIYNIWRNTINSRDMLLPQTPTHAVTTHPPYFDILPRLLKLNTMATAQLIKTRASSLAKVAALPRHRHPADLLNEHTLPYKLQKQMINAEVSEEEGQYYSSHHFQLSSYLAKSRLQYRQAEGQQRQSIAEGEFKQWEDYLTASMENPQAKLNSEQKEKVYEAMMAAKQRNEQRLALNRFVKFGRDFSAGFHVDFPLNPVIIMRLVHPHFGYLNLFPNQARYKLTHEQLFTFIEQVLTASLIRDKGHTLHSSEVLSFILWKALTDNKARVMKNEFAIGMSVFKFRDLQANNIQEGFAYSLPDGQIKQQDDGVRFETLRQIFLDRGL